MRRFDDEQRQRLVSEAHRLRAQLADTLEVIERRRHQLLDLRWQARHHVPLLAGAGGALVALLAGGAVYAAYRARTRGPRMRHERWRALVRAWRHPRDVARHGEGGVLAATASRVTTGLLGIAATRLVRRLAAPAPARPAPIAPAV